VSPCCAPGSPTRRARPGEELRAPGPGLPPLTSAVSRPGGRVGAVPAETASASRPSPTRPSDRSDGGRSVRPRHGPARACPNGAARGRGGDGRTSAERLQAAGPCGPSAVRRRADGWLRPPPPVFAPPRRSDRAAREGSGRTEGKAGRPRWPAPARRSGLAVRWAPCGWVARASVGQGWRGPRAPLRSSARSSEVEAPGRRRKHSEPVALGVDVARCTDIRGAHGRRVCTCCRI